MRCNKFLINSLAVCIFFLLMDTAQAATPTLHDLYEVTLDTAPLIGNPAGPFTIVFGFVDGSGFGDSRNTVTITNVDLTGGTALGAPIVVGGSTGDLTNGVLITDTSFLNVFYESFSAGATLRFTLSLTMANNSGVAPDRFAFYILDGSGVPLPTHAPAADYFLGIDLASDGVHPDIYSTDPSRFPSTGKPISMNAPKIQFVSKQVKLGVRDAFQKLPPRKDPRANGEQSEVVLHLEKSLRSALWIDNYHLTTEGDEVFEEEERAVHEIKEIERIYPLHDSLLDYAKSTLAFVDRALAQTVLDEARKGSPNKNQFNEAQEEITYGDKSTNRGEYGAAIEHYREAWIVVNNQRRRTRSTDE